MEPKTQSAPLAVSEYLKNLRAQRQQVSQTPQVEKPKPPKKEETFPGIPKPQPKKVVLTWQTPSRPFKKRDRQYYVTLVAIVFLISLILFFAGQFLPIAVVFSVAFLAYVLSSVPPEKIKIEISTYGIEVESMLYYWEEMGRFWFDQQHDNELLLIEIARFPGRLSIVLGEQDKKELKELLSEVLLEEKPADTSFDKAARWLQDKIPLEINN